MRNCWIDHDKCADNCPCHEKCLNGCPEPVEGHPCETPFCQGFVETCAAEDDNDRIDCPHGDEASCVAHKCCWVPYTGKGVPYCHYKKRQNLNPYLY